jgi:hypothetical protein
MENKVDLRKKTVIFIHIPKTAGTTFGNIIKRQYLPSARFPIYSSQAFDHFKDLSQAQKSKIRLLHGHIPFGYHKMLAQPSLYITFLREPVDRVISHYYYVRQHPEHELYDLVVNQNLSLKDYVCSGILPELDNGQCRMLAGLWGAGIKSEIPFGECPAEVLDIAKRNLRENIAGIGLKERFDESLVLIGAAFRWRNLLYVSENVTANKPHTDALGADVVACMEDCNRLDIELYRYGRQLFEQQINQLASFNKDLIRFRRFNSFYNQIYPFYFHGRSLAIRPAKKVRDQIRRFRKLI